MSSGNFEDDERFDGLYLNVAQTTRGIEPLLDTVFSFLRRKTDFFAGPPGSTDGSAAAVEKVNQVLQKHAKRYQTEQEKKENAKKAKPSISNSKTTTTANVDQSSKNQSTENDGDDDDDKGAIEMGTDGNFDISMKTPPSSKPVITPLSNTGKSNTKTKSTQKQESSKPPPAESSGDTPSTAKVEDKSKGDDDEDDDNDEPPPVGNGGTVPGKYVWTQSLAEVVVNIPVPDHTRGRDLQVTIARTHLKVVLKTTNNDKQILVDGDLHKPIICDDSFWTVEDGNRLVINLQKQNQMEWWDCVCQGDPTINVRKVNPENSSLADLDGETRKTVEKMMFDQRQKALGLPTSEEQTKLDALENFRKHHPELDFSNAKIC